MRSILSLLILIVSVSHGYAQVEIDSLSQVKDTTHSVKKAALYSALLPGLGQVYNQRANTNNKKDAFWKVPLIYAGLGGMTYFVIKNSAEIKDLKAEYQAREEGTFLYDKYSQYDQNGVLTLFRQSQTQRDLAILGFIGIYAIQILEAAVNAHFVNFDVSEDLSIHLRPQLITYNTLGLNVRINFKYSSKKYTRFAP